MPTPAWFPASSLQPDLPPCLGVLELGPFDLEVWHDEGRTWLFVAIGETGEVVAVVPAAEC